MIMLLHYYVFKSHSHNVHFLYKAREYVLYYTILHATYIYDLSKQVIDVKWTYILLLSKEHTSYYYFTVLDFYETFKTTKTWVSLFV